MYGGAVGAVFLAPTLESARKAGIPENTVSIYAIVSLQDLTTDLGNGMLLEPFASDVDEEIWGADRGVFWPR